MFRRDTRSLHHAGDSLGTAASNFDLRSVGLQPQDAESVETKFGVSPEQVERDHMISHMLAGIARSPIRDGAVFIGGTALSRTYLPDLRLSEDIDLMARRSRSEVAPGLTRTFESALARTRGRLTWAPRLESTSGSGPATAVADGRLAVQVQLLTSEGYLYPFQLHRIEQRYSDVPETQLLTLTQDGFVVAKLAAWADRRAPRDLYDLWALAEAGLIGEEGMELYCRTGPTGGLPRPR